MTTKTKDKPAKAGRKPLTDPAVRSKKPGTHPDGVERGLFLIVTPTGTKSWRLRYWVDKKEYVHTLGRYEPDSDDHMGLDDARTAAKRAKVSARQGTHPKDIKQAEDVARKAKAARTFDAVSKEFIEYYKTKDDWKESTVKGHGYTLKAINLIMGPVPINEVDVGHIKAVINHYQGKKAAQRFAFGVVKRVLDFAKVSRYVAENVAQGCETLLPKKKNKEGERSQRHHPAITKVDPFAEYLRKLYTHPGRSSSFYGLKLLAMLPVRPVELARMKWTELDLEAGWWNFRMTKVDELHAVPLPRQALVLLGELQARRAGHAEYVLPSRRDPSKPTHPDSFRLAQLKQLGYELGTVSGHGGRATWRTLGQKPLKIDVTILELAMGHETKDPLGHAYNRNEFLEERFEAAQLWADWLDELRAEPLDGTV